MADAFVDFAKLNRNTKRMDRVIISSNYRKMSGKGSPRYLQYLKEQEAKAYERETAIIAVDSGQKEIIYEDYNINPEKVHAIYD